MLIVRHDVWNVKMRTGWNFWAYLCPNVRYWKPYLQVTFSHTRTGTANNTRTVICRHTDRQTTAMLKQSCYKQWPTYRSTNKYGAVTNKQRKRRIASFMWREVDLFSHKWHTHTGRRVDYKLTRPDNYATLSSNTPLWPLAKPTRPHCSSRQCFLYQWTGLRAESPVHRPRPAGSRPARKYLPAHGYPPSLALQARSGHYFHKFCTTRKNQTKLCLKKTPDIVGCNLKVFKIVGKE